MVNIDDGVTAKTVRVLQLVDEISNGNEAAFCREIQIDKGSFCGYKTKGNWSLKSIDNILSTYPEVSAEWLMRGEGEMYREGVRQTSYGDNSPNVNGDNNNVGAAATDDLVRLLQKRDEQIDRLLTLLENERRER